MTRLLAVVLAALLLVSGCSKGSDGSSTGASPRKALAAAKKNLDDTSGVQIGLATPKLPAGVNGLLKADGIATHAPAFQGVIKIAASGVTADASVVAVDQVVYAKLPFTTQYVTINPADYGAPDPAALLDPQAGLSSLLTSATDVQAGGQVRQGKEVLRTYDAKVPGKAVAAVIPSADANATFDATFTVDDQDRLTKAVLTGPFYPKGGDVTYTITFDHYGTTKNITAP